jgi:hypothetical protein
MATQTKMPQLKLRLSLNLEESYLAPILMLRKEG